MSSLLPLALLAAAASEPRLLAVRTEFVGSRAAVRLLMLGELGEVVVRREADEVVIALQARAEPMPPPETVPPIEAVRIEAEPPGLAVRIRVPAELPYEVRREATALVLLFGAPPQEEPIAPRPSDVAELYRSILPPPAEEAGLQLAGLPGEAAQQEEPQEGVALGRLRLLPSVAATYVDADTLVDTPQPVRDRYFQVQPHVGATLPLGTGRLTGAYEARLRRGSAYSQVNETSQFLSANLELPLGPSLVVRGSEYYSAGVLETTEVDPGLEYFFQLGRFHRNELGGGLRLDSGGLLDLDLSGSLNTVTVGPEAAFFSYETRRLGAALGYELGASTRAALGYTYERVPAPAQRPEAESTAQSVGLALTGEVLPLVRGELTLGYRDQRNPLAGPGGTRYRGLSGSLNLTKDFTRSSRASVLAGRSTPLSDFEQNGFYVATFTGAELAFGLPFALAGRAGAGYHWNDYRTVASRLGEPRKDRIFGWSFGLGRPITRWAYLRADYRQDRRDSNLDAFDVRTQSFTVQLGVGLFGVPEQRR